MYSAQSTRTNIMQKRQTQANQRQSNVGLGSVAKKSLIKYSLNIISFHIFHSIGVVIFFMRIR